MAVYMNKDGYALRYITFPVHSNIVYEVPIKNVIEFFLIKAKDALKPVILTRIGKFA